MTGRRMFKLFSANQVSLMLEMRYAEFLAKKPKHHNIYMLDIALKPE